MDQSSSQVAQRLVRSVAVGALAGVAVIGAVVWFDVSAIGSLLAASLENPLLAALVLGGSLTKGATLGFVFGLARLAELPVARRATAPALAPEPLRA